MLEPLKQLEKRGHRETAVRTRNFASRVFRHGVATARCSSDPAALEGRLGMIGQGPKPWGQPSLVYGKRLAIWQGWQRAGGYDGLQGDLRGELVTPGLI
ncbi:MAG: hypothetical protein Q8Q53_13585 [Novosphingobium sp.]|nr:hypothetical protein [Novosphingobium sp.]MDP3908232.1 hypothetical protein [Novosphingobium sp.]